MSYEVAQKLYDARPAEGMLLDLQHHPSIHRQRADCRHMIAGQRHAQDRCLSMWRILADPGGQQVEAGFVDPHDSSAFRYGFF